MILCIALPLLIISVASLSWIYLEGKSFQYAGLEIDKLDEVEERFQREPNLKDCVFLADRYGYVLKDNSKGIEYAEQCLELEETPGHFRFRIYFWLADFNHKAGNTEKSEEYLKIALKMDHEDTIEKHNWIEKHELQSIYNKLENKP